MSGSAIETSPNGGSSSNEQDGAGKVDGRKLYSRITLRLIPYLFILYILAYLDRVNVGFAAVEMKRDLHLSDTIYGTGAGIFFLGSAMFDLPSNLLLQKVGPRTWIARIMITWGIISACMVFLRGEHSFYAMRLLLGISEAGFFPGIILYLTYWFPSKERARAVARFMTATAIAGVVGGPLSSFLLKLDGTGGLKGWQWLFLSEGIPTVLMGISVLFVLRNGPDEAKWLKPEERDWLKGELEADRKQGGSSEKHSLADAFKQPAVWILAGIFFANQIGVYIINLWMPLILSSLSGLGASEASAGASMISKYATIPYIAAAIFMVVVGWNSDRTEERRFHMAGCMILAAAGFALAANAHSIPFAIGALSLAAMGVWSIQGPFWTLPTRMLEGTAAAGGVAIITMVGGVGGFLGPYTIGRLKDITHGFSAGLYAVAGLALVGAAMSLAVGSKKEQEEQGG